MYKKYAILIYTLTTQTIFCSTSDSSEEIKAYKNKQKETRLDVTNMNLHVLKFQFNGNEDYLNHFLLNCKNIGNKSTQKSLKNAKIISYQLYQTLNANQAKEQFTNINNYYDKHRFDAEQRNDVLIDLFVVIYDYKNGLF